MHVELYRKMRCLSVSIRSMHVELYKVFVFWNMRCLSVSIRSMHVERCLSV